jgi:DUF1365 family protein
MKKLFRKEQAAIYAGHVVHCYDKDSGDEFAIEVFVNECVEEASLASVCYDAAKQNETVQMSCNTFRFEYIMPSGKRFRKSVVTTKELLSDTSAEANEYIVKGYKYG